MLKTLLQNIKLHLKNNLAYYGVSAVALLGGAAMAAVCAFSLPELNEKELVLYFGDFFASLAETGADRSVILLSALRSEALLFVLSALFSMAVVGAPLIACIGLYRGFAFGFAISFLMKTYGMRSLLFLLSMLPHLAVMLPCRLALLAVCLRFCVSLVRGRTALKKRIFEFILLLAGLFLLALAGVLLQAYIEPLLLECFAAVFV